VGQNWWLSIWSNETTRLEKEGLHIHSGKYMTLYFTLGLVSLFVQGGRALLLVLGSFNASRRLHANLLAKVMRLPMAFFDSQPTGRLLNRYVSHLDRVCCHTFALCTRQKGTRAFAYRIKCTHRMSEHSCKEAFWQNLWTACLPQHSRTLSAHWNSTLSVVCHEHMLRRWCDADSPRTQSQWTLRCRTLSSRS